MKKKKKKVNAGACFVRVYHAPDRLEILKSKNNNNDNKIRYGFFFFHFKV